MSDKVVLIQSAVSGAQSVAAELSEDSLATAFEKEHTGKVVYCHLLGKWRIYDSVTAGIWRDDETELVAHWAREFVRRLNTEQQAKWGKAAVVESVARLARRAPSIAVSGLEFDADPWLLGTPAGPYDLKTAKKIKPRPELMISKATAIAPESGAPKLWLRILDESTGGDKDLIDYLQRLLGYCLTGHTSEESLEFFYGPGGNGKGLVMGAALNIAGTYGRQASMDTFLKAQGGRHPTDLASLVGARLVMAAESAEGSRWDEQRVKMATGRDRISARFMKKDFFEFSPQFTLLIASNHKPRIGTVDDAWRRRLHLIPFEQKPTKPDPDLKDKLKAEYPQILQWMIDGAEWWGREGLAPPESVLAATAEYLREEDVIGLWFREHCEEVPATNTTYRNDLYHSFENWAHEMGHAASSQHKMTRWLKSQGYEQTSSSTDKSRPFRGIRLVPDEGQN